MQTAKASKIVSEAAMQDMNTLRDTLRAAEVSADECPRWCALDGLKRVCVKCIEKHDERQRKENDEVRAYVTASLRVRRASGIALGRGLLLIYIHKQLFINTV